MKSKNLFICLAILSLILPACDWFRKAPTRETIQDKIVNIPDKLVLDIPQLPPLCDEISNLKKGYADILDGKLYYEEEGQGIPLVLISGGPGCTHHGFHPYFSQLKDIAKVIYYDQRGIGKSSKDDTGKTYTVKQAVEDLESLRQALKIDKWVVLGWSYGGLLAQCYALTYPQHCIGLILGASTTGVSDNVMQPVREKIFLSQSEIDAIENIKKMAREGKITAVQSAYNANLAGNWKRPYYNKPTNEAMIRNALYVWHPAPGFEELMRPESNNLNAISFLKNKFDDFEIPTLIVEAKWELLWWNPDRIEDMRKNHPHAQLEIFEKSGHMMFVDEPEKFFSLLRNFLKKSSEAKIAYKPGNRLTWPTFRSDLETKTIMEQALYSTHDEPSENQVVAIVKDALSTLGDITVKKLKGGLSGAQLFIADDGTKKYVVRFLTHKTPEKRSAEINSLKIASKHGYGPHICFVSDSEDVVIMEYLHAQPITLEQRKSKELYEMLGRLLRKMHSGPALSKTLDVFSPKRLHNIQASYKDIIPASQLEAMDKKLTEIHQIVAPYIVTAPCHIDLNPNNLIFIGTDFKAIDYETAAQADPYYDVATVAIWYTAFSTASENILLSTYLEHEPTPKEGARLYLMKQVAFMSYAVIFLKLAEQKKQLYETLNVPSYLDFVRTMSDLENPETQLRFAKVIINQLLINFESQEFKDAINVLRGTDEK